MVRAAVEEFEVGKLEAANRLLEAARVIEPDNKKARYYLVLVEDDM